MTTLVFDDLTTQERHVVQVRRLLVAGFTGRDQAAVQEHIDELAAMGVPVPEATPSLYVLDADLVRQSPVLVVAGPETSGEVEPVVVMTGGRLLLTVGSDHTDRELEREDIGRSKQACQKLLGLTCVPVDAVPEWDASELSSRVDGEAGDYQHGTLASLLPLADVLEHLRGDHGLELADGDVLFLGTLPAIGGIRPAGRFEGTLSIAGLGALSVAYDIIEGAGLRRVALAKPELEFAPVDDVAWTDVPGGVAGQTERILATDATTGVATRMLHFEPGTDTSGLGVVRHDFWEEVFILEGDLHDLTLGQTFEAGTYACRPPGMPHGPWVSRTGCTTFEVRYPAS